MDKITRNMLFVARAVLGVMEEDGSISEEMAESIKLGGNDPDVIVHLAKRMRNEGSLPEEKHRYQSAGKFKEWSGNSEETMPEEILSEFAVDAAGYVHIKEEEFLDVLAYIAEEYYG